MPDWSPEHRTPRLLLQSCVLLMTDTCRQNPMRDRILFYFCPFLFPGPWCYLLHSVCMQRSPAETWVRVCSVHRKHHSLAVRVWFAASEAVLPWKLFSFRDVNFRIVVSRNLCGVSVFVFALGSVSPSLCFRFVKQKLCVLKAVGTQSCNAQFSRINSESFSVQGLNTTYPQQLLSHVWCTWVTCSAFQRCQGCVPTQGPPQDKGSNAEPFPAAARQAGLLQACPQHGQLHQTFLYG